MVCKENVVSWFGNLSSYKRIDVMCTLLNMCLPFEVRYLGTCVEDIGKRDYNDLRDTEHHANSASDLAELITLGVTDKRTRRKLALYVALLHSCNYACAVILYKNLSNLDYQEITNLLSGTSFTPDDQPLEELLLLYTMALNHPAFTYEQKTVFGNIYTRLQEEDARLNLTKSNASYKTIQGCGPCVNTSDRLMDPDAQGCLIAPPQMQPYHGEMTVRNNTLVSRVPPGLTMPPPGLCLPNPEQMPGGSTGATQYVHLGFPSVNHMPPWTGQLMMGNQLMYHTGDVLAYPPSPLVSRQSSPSQSRSPSRSNSPMGRRNNTMPRTSSQVTQSTSNTLTTSSGASNNPTSICGSSASSLSLHSTLSTSRSVPSQAPLVSSRTVPVANPSSTVHSRHNNIENTSSSIMSAAPMKQSLPHRVRSSISSDSLRDSLGKELPNFKGNLQNCPLDEIKRMSDEDLREIGWTPSAVGQLRSIVKSQTVNGLNQVTLDKKLENPSGTSHMVDQLDHEGLIGMDAPNDGNNPTSKSMPLQEQHPAMHHHHNHAVTPNVRRYSTMAPVDPAQVQMYHAPPPIYTPQNAPCYACLTVPVAGVPNRYSRCNTQHVFCVPQLQALKLDPDSSSRHCSQSSSSDSTGSRSPPETPPAVPWISGSESNSLSVTDHINSPPVNSTGGSPHSAPPQQLMQSTIPERQRNRRNQTHVARHKNQMVNGNGPPSLPHCVSFPAPPSHSQVTYLPPGHFPTLRPSSGIYSNFSHVPYTRPTYPTTYQPNGEMIYQYSGHPTSGATPPPAPNATQIQAPYMPSTPVVTYAPAAVPPPKISCYNCGSSNHLPVDCKDQTMEDLTKKAQYRLDYTIMKQAGECSNSEK